MKNLFLVPFIFLCFSVLSQRATSLPTSFDYPIPPNEIGCMRNFIVNCEGVEPVNAFLLAKMSELMYPERLDYQLRYLENNSKPLQSLYSTDSLKILPLIDKTNFKIAFESRFKHYFEDSLNLEKTSFYYIEKPVLDTVRFLGLKVINGYDPELIVINSDQLILILYRGTDDVENNRYAEWKGSDFTFSKIKADSVLNHSKIHKGFWKSFELVKDDLITLLDSLGGKKKAIWLSGHSLGGAMAILSGVYLKKLNFNVTNIYTYAAPIAIGDKTFAAIGNTLLANRINRFEYYLDPVSIISMPGYKIVGNRHWFDNATKSNYTYYANCSERHAFLFPKMDSNKPGLDLDKKALRRIYEERSNSRIAQLPVHFFYHNTQWYVKGTYLLISPKMRSELPKIDDSYPFIYYGWNQAK